MDPDYDLTNYTQYYNISGDVIFYGEIGVIGLFVTLRGRQPQLPLAARLRKASKLAEWIKEKNKPLEVSATQSLSRSHPQQQPRGLHKK